MVVARPMPKMVQPMARRWAGGIFSERARARPAPARARVPEMRPTSGRVTE